MRSLPGRRRFLASAAGAIMAAAAGATPAQERIRLRLSTPATATDQRSVGLATIFGPAVAAFADYEPHYNATLVAQGSEIEAIAAGDLEMAMTSAQDLAAFLPEFSIFAAGYVHQDAAHQQRVFEDPLMEPFRRRAEEVLGVRLVAVMYLGRRHVNLRMPASERRIITPADLAGVRLRMPASEAWQFLGRALGADPTPLAFTEIYTALQTGAVDGQDNPLPTIVNSKFHEVTRQVALTSHLVDFTWLALSARVWNALAPAEQAVLARAAEDAAASARRAQLNKEEDLVAYLRAQGLEIYEPDVAAFRAHVQARYLGSEHAAQWPAGVLERINALGR